MHIRVYGVQPDEMETYRRAETQFGFTFEYADAPLSEETVDQVHDCDALIFLTNSSVTDAVAAKLAEKGVKYLAARSAGTDHVDYKAVVKHGLHCCNVPFYAPEAISEHTILLALSIVRNAKKAARKVQDGDYTMAGLKGRQIGQMKAGVFGSGRIGRTTMQMLNGFGAQVVSYDPFENDAARKLCTYVTKEELLKESDIVFMHCPLTPENEHLIREETLAQMKDGAFLVNTARGGLVDHAAVLKALEEGKLAGFAFDVYENEAAFVRKKKTLEEIGDPVFSALLARENVIYTPHVAFYTDGAIINMIEVTLENLKEYEETGACRNEVKEEMA